MKDIFNALDSNLDVVKKRNAFESFIQEVKRYYVTLNDYGLASLTMELKLIAESENFSPKTRELALSISQLTILYAHTLINLSEKPTKLQNGDIILSKINNQFYEKMLAEELLANKYSRQEAASYLALKGIHAPENRETENNE